MSTSSYSISSLGISAVAMGDTGRCKRKIDEDEGGVADKSADLAVVELSEEVSLYLYQERLYLGSVRQILLEGGKKKKKKDTLDPGGVVGSWVSTVSTAQWGGMIMIPKGPNRSHSV